ncbi:putative N-acetyltransferase YycN [Streptomyces sp. YIM 130001]|uniref:GNAT family N-acetyltransferase n=1 Tax=Streptomyces sp. YIM 130001 TaxID=2259644 RepID=UPI000E64E959|nr:GNAT family N-acetyltransferase [Streptomyces sp. YIM 130001]RII18645.1 putative N-acetyltransferase YycN [Streptomyces sp. YIM 130001]
MTTTLRPTGPIQQSDERVRSRRYEVCVNSRAVGETELATHEVFGPEVGRILALRIDDADRGRGRGTVAALAAEEVLRGWGCRRVETTVPADAAAALSLAQALGYTERNQQMSKPLTADEPVALPDGSRGRPMTEAEYVHWREAGRNSYARSWIDRGVPEAEARAKAEHDHARLMPEGLHTPGIVLRVLEDSAGQAVGTLWVSLDDAMAFVYDVKVDERYRGRGHGRSLMLLAESEVLAAGRDVLGLNVFAGNVPALCLYESLGYQALTHYFYKDLV